MLAQLSTPNVIHSIVTTQFFRAHLPYFHELDANVRFPTMSEEELPKITLGVYQLKQAKSYAHRHKKARLNDESPEYLCYYAPDDVTRFFFANIIREKNIKQPLLVMTKMISRHIGKKSTNHIFWLMRVKMVPVPS